MHQLTRLMIVCHEYVKVNIKHFNILCLICRSTLHYIFYPMYV